MVRDIRIESERTLLWKNERLTLTASVDANGSASDDADWSSDDEDVATVSSTGVVQALAPGTVTITARSVDDTSKFATLPFNVVSDWSFTLAPDSNYTNLDPIDLEVLNVRTASTGHVVVNGLTFTDFDGEGSPSSGGNSDGFVLVLDAKGNELWRKQFRHGASAVVSTFIRGDRLVLGLNYFNLVSVNPFILETGSGVVVHDLNTGSEVWSYTEPADGSDVVGVVLQSDDTIVALGQRSGDELSMFQSNDPNSWSGTPERFDIAGVGTPVRLDLGADDALQAVFENDGTLSLGEIVLEGASPTFTKSSELSRTDVSNLPDPIDNPIRYESELRFAINQGGRVVLGISEGTEDDVFPFKQKMRVLTGATTPNVDGQITDIQFGDAADQETTIFGVAFNRDDQVVLAGATASTDPYWNANAGFLRTYTVEGQELHTHLTAQQIRGLAIDDANRVVVAKQTSDDSLLTIEALAPQIMQPPANQ